MKKIILNIICLGFLLTSCQDQLDINTSPDALSQDGVAFATELPTTFVGIAGAQGSVGAIIGGMWSQFWAQSNGSNQYRVVDDYSLTAASLHENMWNNMYDALGDIRNIERQALEQENWNYYLITVVMDAYASQILVDFYDEVPYFEANNVNILSPVFDSGVDIYDAMIVSLDDALSKNLSASNGPAPGNDDLVFQGDMDRWVEFANTLKLKIYLRQTEARPSVASSGITNMLNAGVSFLNVDAKLDGFIDADSQSNPLYESDRRQLNTTNNLKASTTLFSFFDENSDTRKDKCYGPGNSLNQGDYNSTVTPTSFSGVLLSPVTPVYFISREHSLFMQAEARERYGIGANMAKALYDAAVVENFNKWELDGSSFVATGGTYEYPSGGSFDEKLEAIITQKWISGFPGNGFETFFEHNRTGIPKESSVPQTDLVNYVPGEFAYSLNGVTAGQFPKRLPFSNTEMQRNENTPALVPITTPVWWNQ